MSSSPRHARSHLAAQPAAVRRRARGGPLVLMDEAPLKSAAWAELHAARKRQEKAARDLHRHEEVDRPAYDGWLHRTFPTLLTRLRELHQEVFTKGQRVESVLAIAAMTGRSASKIWREQKAREAEPPAPEAERDSSSNDGKRNGGFSDDPFGEDDFFEDEPSSSRRPGGDGRDAWAPGSSHSGPLRPGREAREIYRRLVQLIHPDRGGEWTPARQRLWHEVQEAWAAGDADWLMRLEVEWEAAHDVIDPTSPLSRLRRATEEFHAARRDTERKLRAYRESPPWRFTLAEKKRPQLHRRTESGFEHDIAFLQKQLDHLNATIAGWEESPRTRRRARQDRYWEVGYQE